MAGMGAAVLELVLPREYMSVKFVRVSSRPLAVLHRAVFVAILAYVVGFQLVRDRGYQTRDSFSGTPVVKMKGVALGAGGLGEVFDAVDLTQPALEESAVFVQTNSLETRGQKRGLCTGVDRRGEPPAAIPETCDCGADPQGCAGGSCQPGLPTANGFTTGRCINTESASAGGKLSPRNALITRGGLGWMCEIEAWCPLEDEKGVFASNRTSGNVLPGVGNFTVFVRVDGRFPNLDPNRTFSNFDRGLVWNENLFYLSDLVAAAALQEPLAQTPVQSGQGPQRMPQEHIAAVLERGAELVVEFDWDCNLDAESDCMTNLKVHRIDGGKGFNYRSARQYTDPEDPTGVRRDLIKRYGLRIVFRVTGRGGKFDLVQLGVVLGSGLGLLGIATVVADMLLLVSRRGERFIRAKYEAVQGRSASWSTSTSAQAEPREEGAGGAAAGRDGAAGEAPERRDLLAPLVSN